MNTEHFYSILQNPRTSAEYIQYIKNISQQYPYFSAAQLLYLSYLYQNNDDAFSIELKRISHNIPNRKYLFEYLKKIKQYHLKKTLSNTPSNTIITSTEISESTKRSNISTSAIQNDLGSTHPSTKNLIITKEEKSTTEIIQNNENTANTKTTTDSEALEKEIQKEINKSIAESIVQKEIIEIAPTIKEKVQEFSPNIEKSISPSEPIEANLTQAASSEESSYPVSNSLAHLLKQFSKSSTTTPSPSAEQTRAEVPSTDKKERIKKQQELIDKIISNLPKTPKVSTSSSFYSAENKAKESLLETEDLVTETLAQIYAAQGNIHKAIRAYEILSLKFPQKNTYFAAKIEELKKQLKK
jgi:hypothetical protein